MVQRAVTEQPFDIDDVFARVRDAVRPYPKAALFELFDEGHTSVFEQLVACIISTRTLDETTLVVARRLFAVARTPEAIQALGPDELQDLLRGSSFHDVKARQIVVIARHAAEDYGGSIPGTYDTLTSFHGVGPKCANLVLAIACGESRIAVDVHVHRVTNRWGYVATRTPEETHDALKQRLPRRYWVESNRLLMPFGKYVCTGVRPKCSTCPVLEYCPRIGVVDSR